MFLFRSDLCKVVVKALFIFGTLFATVHSSEDTTINRKLSAHNILYSISSSNFTSTSPTRIGTNQTFQNGTLFNASTAEKHSFEPDTTAIKRKSRNGKSSFSSSYTSNPDNVSNSSFSSNAPLDLGYYIYNAYNNSDNYYGYNTNSTSFYGNYQYPQASNQVDLQTSISLGQTRDSYFPTMDDPNNYDTSIDQTNTQHYTYQNYPSVQADGYQDNQGQQHPSDGQEHGHGHNKGNGHEESHEFEIEDKVFSKTVVATKALKVGKAVFVFFMVLVVLIIAALGKLGIALSPVVLPLALLPIGLIAVLLFIPLFVLFVPLVATGVAGERKRRRRREAYVSQKLNADTVIVDFITSIEDNLSKILDSIETMEWNND